MSVIRVNKTKDYTVISNTHFKEKNMTLKAKGLLSLMLSLPDDWDYSIAGLVAICKENESAIKSTLNELKIFGYLTVIKKMPNVTQSGRIEYEYNIYEQPQKKQEPEIQGVENLKVEALSVENPRQLNTNKVNTDKVNTELLNINNIKENNKEKDYEIEFNDLWKLYPNKKGKDKALKSYIKARKEGTAYEDIEKGLKDYVEECKIKNREIQYIKHGATWFNNRCWNDEYDLTPIKTNNSKNERGQNNGFDFTNLKVGEYY